MKRRTAGRGESGLLRVAVSIFARAGTDALANPDRSGCAGCHGDFQESPYYGTAWIRAGAPI